jgi:transaldolase/glucose-6-phosphate isomerase
MVSLEVNPHLARDTEGTIEEARRLWKAVDRPNLMIKVPATPAGIPAIEQLIAEGINVNVTLMFSLDDYENVAQAYIRGLERADDPSGIVSVASFFISRVSRRIDAKLEELDRDPGFDGGDVAIANARLTYRRFQEIFLGEPFRNLRDRGALVQRPLWASTSTKNPAYSDVRYVEELIGPDTVNTVPPHTLDAFRDHGSVRGHTVTEHLEEAERLIDRLPEFGPDLYASTTTRPNEGVQKFAAPFDSLMETLEEKRKKILGERREQISFALDGYSVHVRARLDRWEEEGVSERIWRHDPTVWAEEDTPEITYRLGWLRLP